MNPSLKLYLNSFKPKKEHAQTLLINSISFGLIFLIFYILSKFLEQKAQAISQGQTTEQLKQMILSNPEQAQLLLSNLKGFYFSLIGGVSLAILLGLFLYSLSGKLIWNYLTKEKTKYWRWNLLNLVLIIPTIIYILLFALIKLVLIYFASLTNNATFITFASSLLNLFFFLTLIIFGFLVYYTFNQKYQVWESLGEAFHLLKTKFEKIWKIFLFAMFTAVILSLLLWPLNDVLAFYTFTIPGFNPPITLSVLGIINIAIILLFLTWLRLYVFRTIKE